MKTIIAMMLVVSSLNLSAQQVPEFLKGGTVTVTDKNGKQYKFSSDEYAAVPRHVQVKPKTIVVTQPPVERVVIEKQFHEAYIVLQPKNIVSVEVLRSQHGLKTSQYSNSVSVESDRDTGAGIMYQRNVYKSLYLGGRVDTNNGYGLNIGLGF